MKILLVEDELGIQDFICRSLMEIGYKVDVASTAKEAELRSLGEEYAALVLDLGLPDGDGLDMLARCRSQGFSAPVLILSARRSVDERVIGLEQGGDDYLTKPFAMAELIARLRNLLRRSAPATQGVTKLRVLDLELDLVRRDAWRAGVQLQLTPQEFTLLEYLCRNAGRVVTRSMILDQVWKMRIDPETNVIDVHIYRLRTKIDQGFPHPLIRTIRGVGYVLRDK
jgi:two-component system copper resistance phosphate regulon response regulator CusR